MRSLQIPSDRLTEQRTMISRDRRLVSVIGMPLQIRLVIDANCVISTLRWLVGKRRNPLARSALQEALDSGTIIAFAPDQLRDEVEEHIPAIAEELAPTIRGAEVLLREEWRSLQRSIHFSAAHASGDSPAYPPASALDPDDVPYILLCEEIGGAGIVSQDGHIAAMGGTPVGPEVIMRIRDYARAKSVEVTIKLGGYSLTVIAIASVMGVMELLAALGQLLMRLPTRLQIAGIVTIVAGVAIAIVHPHSRSAGKETLLKVAANLSVLAGQIEPVLATLATESANAADAYQAISLALPNQHRARLEVVAISVCIAAGEPLPLREIATRALNGGYRPRSADSRGFEKYLRSVLGKSARFVRGNDDCWSVSQ